MYAPFYIPNQQWAIFLFFHNLANTIFSFCFILFWVMVILICMPHLHLINVTNVYLFSKLLIFEYIIQV